MKLAVSNLGWDMSQNETVYTMMQEKGYCGLEIAPGLIFGGETPYSNRRGMKKWKEEMDAQYGFCIPSMQSIWFGRTEQIFGSPKERETLLAYTKQAMDAAEILGCHNLVFGCPRNRSIPQGVSPEIVVPFFRELGNYADSHNTVLAMEPVSAAYNTNYMNKTADAVRLIGQIGSNGFKLNLDTGTMITNQETVEVLSGNAGMINHVHISEPGMAMIRRRVSGECGTVLNLHEELADFLKKNEYSRYVSIEVGKTEDLGLLEEAMDYIKDIFGN